MAAGALPRAATMSSCTHAAKYPDCGISRQIPESAKGYVSALRWAHDKCRVSISQFDTRALQQVLRGAQALMFTARRAVKDALLWDDVRKLVRVALRAGEIAAATEYVLASNFLFRVPSELLPLSYERCLEVDGGRTLQVELKRRKNRP